MEGIGDVFAGKQALKTGKGLHFGIFSKKTANHFHLGPGYDIKMNGDVYNEMTVPVFESQPIWR